VIKKIIMLSSLVVFSPLYTMNQEIIPIKKYVVYSHGYCERGNGKDYYAFLGDECSAPTYPDAPLQKGQRPQLNQAVFYTKPSVFVLAEHLKDIAYKKDCKGIILVGNSCGAGTADNCLAALVSYEKDKNYFEGSTISGEDAETIMAKINNGAYISTAPLMSLRKVGYVSEPSALLTSGTIASSAMFAYYCASFLHKKIAKSSAGRFGFLVAGMATWYLCQEYLNDVYDQAIVNWIVPYLTNYNFDPNHAEPIQSVELLRGKLTCPILMQFHAQDGVLEGPDADTIRRYDALKGENTYIVITNDSWHRGRSQQFQAVLDDFKKILGGEKIESTMLQPSVDELREQIFIQKSMESL
jgi:hypothetical protein